MSEVSVSFVSRKVSKIKWRPNHTSNVLQNEDVHMIVSGSWDDDVNNISLWNIPCVIDDNDSEDNSNNGEIKLLFETVHKGDVTALDFLSADFLISASSFGSVNLYKFEKEESLISTQSWDKIHHFAIDKAPCTGLASKNDEISSIGEDGRIITLNINRKTPLVIKDSESCSLTCVSYVRQQELVVGTSRGHLKMWDLKSKSNTPAKTFSLPGYQAPIMSLNQHPSQAHVVATGGQDGNLSIWDLRQDYHPVAVLNGHSGAISDVKFHHGNPDIIFTSSFDGTVWQWDASSIKRANSAKTGGGGGKLTGLDNPQISGIGNPWLNCDATKHRLDIFSLLPTLHNPVNCLDVKDNVLICGCDNEAIYVVTDIKT